MGTAWPIWRLDCRAPAEGAGRISIIYGVSGDWAVPPDGEALANSPASFVGVAGAGIGSGMAAVGDVNGDGYDDLLAADPLNKRAHLIFGCPNAPGRDLLLGDSARSGLTTLLSLPAGKTLQDVGPAGDVNGDGLDDIFITTGGDANNTYLVLGQSLWLSQIDIEAQAAAVVDWPSVNAIVRNAGDLDGDGLGDFVMAVPGQDVYLFQGDASLTARSGAVYTLSDGQALDPDSHFSDTTLIAVSSGSDGRSELLLNKGNSIYRCLGNEDGSLDCSAVINSISDLSFITAVGNVHDFNNEGLNDLLIGSGTDALLYCGWGNGFKYAVTFTGVQAAAQARYTAAADFNVDGAADLLLVPIASPLPRQFLPIQIFRTGPGYQSAGFYQRLRNQPDQDASLHLQPPLAQLTVEEGTTLYVDDDGTEDNQTTVYANIQDAVDAASPGDRIEVGPGVYSAFSINKDNLTIQGVDPDAVFVDGGGSRDTVTISAASGIQLTKLTLRNAVSAFRLENAGVGGYADAAKIIILQNLFIADSQQALRMDRLSTAAVKQCTISGQADSSYILVEDAPDPAFSTQWSSLDNVTGTPPNSEGGKLLADSTGTLYALQGGDSKSVSQLQPGAESWSPYTETPVSVKAGSAATIDQDANLWLLNHDDLFDMEMHKIPGSYRSPVQDIAYISPTEIYITGAFDQIGSTVLNPQGIARWNGTTWESLGIGGSRICPTRRRQYIQRNLDYRLPG